MAHHSSSAIGRLQEQIWDIVARAPEGSEFVAVSADGERPLAYGNDRDQLVRRAKEMGDDNPFLLPVTPWPEYIEGPFASSDK